LAKRELQHAYQEVLTRLPSFRLADPDAVEVKPGMTAGLERLDLVWG